MSRLAGRIECYVGCLCFESKCEHVQGGQSSELVYASSRSRGVYTSGEELWAVQGLVRLLTIGYFLYFSPTSVFFGGRMVSRRVVRFFNAVKRSDVWMGDNGTGHSSPLSRLDFGSGRFECCCRMAHAVSS